MKSRDIIALVKMPPKIYEQYVNGKLSKKVEKAYMELKEQYEEQGKTVFVVPECSVELIEVPDNNCILAWYVDTGRLPNHRAVEYLENVKKRILPDDDSFESKVRNYFFAVNADGRSSRVEKMSFGEEGVDE